MRAPPLTSVILAGLAAVLLGACTQNLFVQVAGTDGGVGLDAGTFDGGADAGTADAGLDLTATCAVLDGRRCDYLARCGLLADTAAEHAACVASLTQRWCGPGTWPAQVAARVLRVDAGVLRACADAFLTQACADFATLPADCGGFLVPAAGLHQPCYDGYSECTEGVCRGAACPRTCQLPGQFTEVCSVDDDCRTGLYCSLSTTTPGIGQCKAYAQVQEGCDDLTLCLDGLWCVAGTCHTVPTKGQSCALGRCDDLSYCDLSGDAGICQARKGTGEDCLQGQCLDGFICSAATSTCLPSQVTGLTAPCTLEQRCPTGATCVGASAQQAGHCAAPLPLDAGCSGPSDCSPDLTCAFSPDAGPDAGGRCALRLGSGAPCASAESCQVDAICLEGRCTPLPALGESCGLSHACRDGTCLSGALLDGGALCTPLLGGGATCTGDAQCASGRCSQGACITACTP